MGVKMKVSLLRIFFLLGDIRHFISEYVEFRKPYSEKGEYLSVSERRILRKKAFDTLESIVNLFIKGGENHV